MKNQIETKPHNPTNMNPAAYEYVGSIYQGPEEDIESDLEALDALADNPYQGNHHKKRTCDHCGTSFYYGCVLTHTSGQAICVGHVCATERFELPDKATWDHKRLLSAAEAARNYGKNQEAARKLLADHPELEKEFDRSTEPNHPILADMKVQLWKKGYLSDKQIEFAKKLIIEIPQRNAQQKERDAQKKNSQFIGQVGQRIVLDVQVLKTISFDTQWGSGWISIMRDRKGNSVKWFNHIEETDGKFIQIKGTIKDHSVYEDEKQTLLSRVVVL